MKERPIIFSGPMVRAILEGRKTQTRRIVKLPSWSTQMWEHSGPYEDDTSSIEVISRVSGCTVEYNCPYGQPGDRLWVRETFAEVGCIGKPIDWFEYHYKADYSNGVFTGYADMCFDRWKPSIHMPRKASRILLEITDVRVEQLLDISDKDAIAEGVESFRPVPGDGSPETRYRDYTAEAKFLKGHVVSKYGITTPRVSFLTLWESINGWKSLESNPCVWVITFKRI